MSLNRFFVRAVAWVALVAAGALPVLGGIPRGSSGGASGAQRVRALAKFPQEETEVRSWMKRNGWKSKRHSPRDFELEGGRLHLVSDDDSVLIGTKRGMPLDPEEWSRVRFRLRVDRVPTGTDLRRKSGDDAAFRLFIAFDCGGGLFRPPNTIGYTWSEDLEPDTVVASPHYGRVRYLSVGSGRTSKPGEVDAENGGWVTIERDLQADYRRLFGEPGKQIEVPPIVGFMIKCDTNNTGTRASAWLADLELVAPEG